jgi:hypothetical protein
VGFVLNTTNFSFHELLISTWVDRSTASHSKSHSNVDHLKKMHDPDLSCLLLKINSGCNVNKNLSGGMEIMSLN